MAEPTFERPDEAAHTCAHCGRPFARPEYVTLHVGLDHSRTLSAGERERFAEVYRGETDEIKRFRLKALAALIAMYFTFLYVYLAVA